MSKLYDLLSAMCGKIKKPDWNQNDPTAPDYVKNRPFYESAPIETAVVQETTVTASLDGFPIGDYPDLIKDGDTGLVSFNGTDYECVAYDSGGGAYALGNASFINAEGGNDEPFFIANIPNGPLLLFAEEGEAVISIKVFATETHQIERKYVQQYTSLSVSFMTDENDVQWANYTGSEILSHVKAGGNVIVNTPGFVAFAGELWENPYFNSIDIYEDSIVKKSFYVDEDKKAVVANTIIFTKDVDVDNKATSFVIQFSDLLDRTSTSAKCVNLELFRTVVNAYNNWGGMPSIYINSWGSEYSCPITFDCYDWSNEDEQYNAVVLKYLGDNATVKTIIVYPSELAYENDAD